MDAQKKIGDRVYSFGFIPPVESVEVQVAVAKVIGEPLFKAFMDYKKTGSSAEQAESAGIAAIGIMLAKMDAEALVKTMETVFKYVSCGELRVDMNATFVGRNKELWQVFIAALQFNFSDFFPASLFASLSDKAATSA